MKNKTTKRISLSKETLLRIVGGQIPNTTEISSDCLSNCVANGSACHYTDSCKTCR